MVPLHRVAATPGGVAITFDDGFQNFYEHAYPVLVNYGFPATVFVVSGACGGTNNWESFRNSDNVPTLPLMDWAQLREIAGRGIELGAHTATHRRLTSIPLPEVEREFDRCRDEIEQKTGKAVVTAAYPYGESNQAVRECASKRFSLCYGTRLAKLSIYSDVSDLPRLDMYYFREPFWFESLWNWYGWAYVESRSTLRRIRQVVRG